MKEQKKLIIVDAMGVVYRAFYAIKHLTNSKGMMTNAAYGFMQILRKILADHNPDYVAIAFDSKEKTFRHEIYEDYKSDREAMPDDLTHQIQYIKDLVEALNLKIIIKPGYEADDIMATLCKRFAGDDLQAIMVTSDKDMYQLVSTNVKALDGRAEKFYDTVEDVIEKFGVEPHHILDMLSLAGDASDSIPGVPGVGPKTAVKLINEYGNLDDIYDNVEKITQQKLKEKLINNKEQAYLSRRLVTLHDDVPFETTLEELIPGEPIMGKLEPLLKELEFTKLLKEYGGSVTSKVNLTTTVVDTVSGFDDLLTKIEQAKTFSFCFDIDGNGTDYSDEVLGVSFALKNSKNIEAFYVPVGEIRGSEIVEQHFISAIRGIMENKNISKLLSDSKFVYKYCYSNTIDLNGVVFDSSIASYLLNPSLNSHDINDLALTEFDINLYFTPPGRKTKEVPLYGDKEAAAKRAFVVMLLSDKYGKDLDESKLTDLFVNLELEVSRVLSQMELRGIKVNRDSLKKLSSKMDIELLNLQTKLYEEAGCSFNIKSPKQLSEILFTTLGLTPIKKTKTGFSTDESVLTALSEVHPVPKKIITYRQVSKLKSTYVDALIELIDLKTGRVHTTFNQTVTATGRLSSSNPNLQNIPVGSGYAEEIRKSFIPKDGCIFIAADYSQIELRLVAHLSQDEILKESFLNNEDIHSRTACEVFSVKPDEVSNDMRRKAKAINFGIIYGMGAFGLATELKVSIPEAQEYIDKYFERYEGVAKFIDKLIEDAKQKGYTETILGRRRAIPELNAPNEQVKRLGNRLAVNTPIQGAAADIMKVAMLNVDKALLDSGFKSVILLQIHDELLLECPIEEADKIKELLIKELENAYKLTVPLTVNILEGYSWNMAK